MIILQRMAGGKERQVEVAEGEGTAGEGAAVVIWAVASRSVEWQRPCSSSTIVQQNPLLPPRTAVSPACHRVSQQVAAPLRTTLPRSGDAVQRLRRCATADEIARRPQPQGGENISFSAHSSRPLLLPPSHLYPGITRTTAIFTFSFPIIATRLLDAGSCECDHLAEAT